MGDHDYNFGPSPRPRRTLPPRQPPLPQEMWGEDIPNRVARNDSGDFVTSMFHEIQMQLEEGRKIELPEELIEEEAMRLGILISVEVAAADAPVQCRAHAGRTFGGRCLQSGVAGLDASSSALVPVGSSGHSPSTTLAAPAFDPPVLDWPWVIPDLVDLTHVHAQRR
ncbi:hypothetical protein QYE76_067732 [Lolium multiflorum]|uniref:Uncharacterized protein n=1 Tax=Lolium multiflorum TaxID=4521 RepID=A0AAD8SD44_LOLMU|nr:hypothetical protein QYE76_067732 [Lolium multiflorum]